MKQWTEDDKARLAMLLRAGRSAGQIAPLFKRSRNAIISMVNRDKSLKAIGFKGQGAGMMVAQAHRTTASAKGFVEDTGFQERHPLRRRRLIDLSWKWQAAQAAIASRSEVIDRKIEVARRKYQAAPIARSATPAREIISMMECWHDVAQGSILSGDRTRAVTAARRDAIVAVMRNCRIAGRPFTYPELGRVFGRDVSTIQLALGKIKARRSLAKRGSHV